MPQIKHISRTYAKPELIVWAVVFLGAAYFMGSKAIGSGSYWHYLAAFSFLILGIKALVRFFKKHEQN